MNRKGAGKKFFRNIPAVNNQRPNGPLSAGDSRKGQKTSFPITYVEVTDKTGMVHFRRAW